MTNPVLRSVTPGSSRRSFIKRGAFAAGVATMSSSLFERGLTAFGREGREEKSGKLTKGDAALLRFCVNGTH
jgi:hypothetical protein